MPDLPVIIQPERPDSPDASALIHELDATLAPLYPAESQHGYSIAKLLAEGVAFFVLRENGVPAACGGLKCFGKEYGEVKRVFVRPEYRSRGYARRIMQHLEDYARAQGLPILRLETGTRQPEAVGLYESLGYRRIGPFGEYPAHPMNLFYEKQL